MKLRGFRAISQSFALISQDMSLPASFTLRPASPFRSLSPSHPHTHVSAPFSAVLPRAGWPASRRRSRSLEPTGLPHFHSIIVRSWRRFGKFASKLDAAAPVGRRSLDRLRRRAASRLERPMPEYKVPLTRSELLDFSRRIDRPRSTLFQLHSNTYRTAPVNGNEQAIRGTFLNLRPDADRRGPLGIPRATIRANFITAVEPGRVSNERKVERKKAKDLFRVGDKTKRGPSEMKRNWRACTEAYDLTAAFPRTGQLHRGVRVRKFRRGEKDRGLLAEFQLVRTFYSGPAPRNMPRRAFLTTFPQTWANSLRFPFFKYSPLMPRVYS